MGNPFKFIKFRQFFFSFKGIGIGQLNLQSHFKDSYNMNLKEYLELIITEHKNNNGIIDNE